MHIEKRRVLKYGESSTEDMPQIGLFVTDEDLTVTSTSVRTVTVVGGLLLPYHPAWTVHPDRIANTPAVALLLLVQLLVHRGES